jgi:broad specificity phosphatase PhoE
MRLYFVRHGVTVEHESKKSQMPDSLLSKEGERQARLLGSRLKKQKLNFDVAFASPFERARRTAEIICEELQIPFEEMEMIHEKLKSELTMGLGRGDDIFDRYLKEMKEFWNDLDWKFNSEGESMREVLDRTKNFEKHLLENHLGQRVLVVSHGLFGSCFIANCILSKSNDDALMDVFHAIKMDNTGLSLLEYDEEDTAWKVRFLNDHSHLS